MVLHRLRVRPGGGYILEGNEPGKAKYMFELDAKDNLVKWWFNSLKRLPFKISPSYDPNSKRQGCCDPPPDAEKRV